MAAPGQLPPQLHDHPDNFSDRSLSPRPSSSEEIIEADVRSPLTSASEWPVEVAGLENIQELTLYATQTASHDSDSITSSTRSIRDSVFEYVHEYGRTYHGYAQGSYLLPNDEDESIRLNLQHWIFKSLLGDREYFAPLDNPRRILDIGTGTGTWAIKIGEASSAKAEGEESFPRLSQVKGVALSCMTMLTNSPGEKFPNAKVTGTDLSPIQPVHYPENVNFLVDDANNEDWGKKKYDYIHTRMLLGSFEDFREIIKRSFDYLEPSGYMESCELYTTLYCDDGTLTEDSPFHEWTRFQDEAAMKIGRPVRIGNKLKRWYEQVGFVDVHEEVFKLPINAWPKDPRFKFLGRFWEQAFLDGLQGFSLALFDRALGWTQNEIEVYLVNVRKAISDRSVHAYHKVYVVWGRKPQEATASS